MDVQQSISLFIASRNARNLQAKTVDWYVRCLIPLQRYCDEHLIFDIEDIKKSHIEELVAKGDRQLSDQTIVDYYIVLKILFDYLSGEKIVIEHPMRGMVKPKAAKKLPRVFTKDEIKAILGNFNRYTFAGMRNYTIMVLLFSTGVRRAELLDIKMDDVQFAMGCIQIRMGKGRKGRIVPMGDALKRTLQRYMDIREEFLNGVPCDYLIVSQRTKEKMTEGGIAILFKRLQKDLGIPGNRFSPHTFRHTFAKTFLLSGGDLFTLQKILGHSTISTTQKYLQLNDKEVINQGKKFNPMDNLSWQLT